MDYNQFLKNILKIERYYEALKKILETKKASNKKERKNL